MARTRTRVEEKNDVARRLTEETAEEDQIVRKDRPTPSARDARPRGMGSGGLVARIPVVRDIVGYFRGVASEMAKVTWPSREETSRLTSVVLGVTIAFAIGLGILDTFFSWWFQQAFHADSEDTFLIVAGLVALAISGSFVTLRKRI